MRVRAGARVPGVPDPRAPAEAVRGGGARRARDAASWCASLEPDVVVNDVLTLAADTRRGARGPPARDAGPPLLSALGAGPAAVRDRRAAAAHARSAARPGGCVARQTGRGVERGRQELNETRRRVGLPPLERPYGGISADLCLVGDVPAARVSARLAAGRARHRAARCGSRPFGDVELPPGEEPLVLVAPSTSQDPRSAAAARGARGARRACRCACSPPTTGARRRSRSSVPRERAARRVDLLLADDAACRRRRLPRRPRHDGARARLRSGGGGRSGCGRHGRERRAARVVGRRPGAADPLPRRRDAALGGAAGCSSDSSYRARARSIAEWSSGNDGAAPGGRAGRGVRRLSGRRMRRKSGYTRPLRTAPPSRGQGR